MSENNAIVLQTGGDFLVPAAPINTMLATYQAKKDFIEKVLQKGTDYGTIPGAGDKPALFKAGAEKMTSFFGLAPTFEDVQTVEDWTGEQHGGEPFFFYRQRCTVRRGERVIGSADGSCNSWEKKYRYRAAQRVCPQCGKPAIITGKAEYGGGYICFAKKGGCGAKFRAGDPQIEGQQVGEIKNPDIADQVNTILKMAQKRALVAAVLIATNISDYFTQDIEDYISGEYTVVTEPKAAPVVTHEPEPEPVHVPEPVRIPEPVRVTYEDACEVLSSDGTRYGDINSDKLAFMATAIAKSLKANHMTEEKRAEHQRKQAAIEIILTHRAGQQK